MQKGRWVFIVNPIAGNGFAGSMVPEIKNKISQHAIDGEIVLTEKPGHASVLSQIYHDKGFSHIIAVGGDGTMNEVAAPLAGSNDVITGMIPAGTGNDFIQILGFPSRFGDKEWDIFFAGNAIKMDAGKVNNKIFLNGMGLGFDAQVAAENYTEEGILKKGGSQKYIWHIIKTLILYREKKMAVMIGGAETRSECFINTIANGRRFAGSFFLTPKAIANDGLLDVCSIKRLNLFQRLRLLLKVPSGKHIDDKKVLYYTTPVISIKFPGKVPFHVDGELSFAQEFNVNIIPGAYRFIYNPDGNHFFRKV